MFTVLADLALAQDERFLEQYCPTAVDGRALLSLYLVLGLYTAEEL